jgi:hypothetical protein
VRSSETQLVWELLNIQRDLTLFERLKRSKADVGVQAGPLGSSNEMFEQSNPGNILLRLFLQTIEVDKLYNVTDRYVGHMPSQVVQR